jgi:hypothetical protein
MKAPSFKSVGSSLKGMIKASKTPSLFPKMNKITFKQPSIKGPKVSVKSMGMGKMPSISRAPKIGRSIEFKPYKF